MKSYSKTLHLVLPDTFQEILIANEMRFDRGERSVHLIRNLLYLYSIGTEYYDTINNPTLYTYYKNKSDYLIRDPDVIAALEDNPKNVEIIELFEENNLYKVVKKGDFNEKKMSDKASCDGSENQSRLKTSPSITFSVDSNNSNDILKALKNNCISSKLFFKLSNLENCIDEDEKSSMIIKYKSNIERFNGKIEEEINKQLEKFQYRKKKRQLKQYLIKKKKGKSYIKRSIEVLKASSNVKVEETAKLLDDIVDLTHRLFLCEQKQMEREIECFIEKNLQEMHASIKELKDSICKEAKDMEDNGFPKIAKLLYEDLDSEIEVLKQQYEESRLSGMDKIRNRFLNHLKR